MAADREMVKAAAASSEEWIWSHRIGRLAADGLLHMKLIAEADFQAASDVIARELYALLSVRDYPPKPRD